MKFVFGYHGICFILLEVSMLSGTLMTASQRPKHLLYVGRLTGEEADTLLNFELVLRNEAFTLVGSMLSGSTMMPGLFGRLSRVW